MLCIMGQLPGSGDPQQIGAFFDGLTVAPPGIVPASRWRPGSEDSAGEDATACCVGFGQ